MKKIETKQDVIDYLEKDLEETKKALKLGKYRDFTQGMEEKEVTDEKKAAIKIVVEYLQTILLPVLRGELENYQTW